MWATACKFEWRKCSFDDPLFAFGLSNFTLHAPIAKPFLPLQLFSIRMCHDCHSNGKWLKIPIEINYAKLHWDTHCACVGRSFAPSRPNYHDIVPCCAVQYASSDTILYSLDNGYMQETCMSLQSTNDPDMCVYMCRGPKGEKRNQFHRTIKWRKKW